MSDSINNKSEQLENREFLKGLSDTEKEKLLQILQNEKKQKDANDSITNATYDLIEKFETGSIGEESPIANLLDEGRSHYYSGPGRSYGNYNHHCYIHNNIPVKIGKITLASIDSIIDKFRSYQALDLPGVYIDKIIDETSKGISGLDKATLFELATRHYKWTLSGKKIIDPEIEFDFNGYHVKANLNNYRQDLLVFKNGKVFPQALIVHHKGKTLEELRIYLEQKYEHINCLLGNDFPNIMEENGSMKKINIDSIDTPKRWAASSRVEAKDTHKDEYTIAQELRLLFFRENCDKYYSIQGVVGGNECGVIDILIGVVDYSIFLPNGSLYSKKELENHTKLKIQRTEAENRQKILDILNDSQNKSRHDKQMVDNDVISQMANNEIGMGNSTWIS